MQADRQIDGRQTDKQMALASRLASVPILQCKCPMPTWTASYVSLVLNIAGHMVFHFLQDKGTEAIPLVDYYFYSLLIPSLPSLAGLLQSTMPMPSLLCMQLYSYAYACMSTFIKPSTPTQCTCPIVQVPYAYLDCCVFLVLVCYAHLNTLVTQFSISQDDKLLSPLYLQLTTVPIFC